MSSAIAKAHRRYAFLALGQRRRFWFLFAALVGPWFLGSMIFTYLDSHPLWMALGIGLSLLAFLATTLLTRKVLETEPTREMPRWAGPLLLGELLLLLVPLFVLTATFRVQLLENAEGDGQAYLLKHVTQAEVGARYIIQFAGKTGYMASVEAIDNKGAVDFAWPEGDGKRGVVDAKAYTGERWQVIFPLGWKSLFGGAYIAPKLGFLTHAN